MRRKVEEGAPLTAAELDVLERAARADGGPTLRLALAHALLNAGEERAALGLLEVLARDFPRDLQVKLGRARALAGVERYAEAEQVLQQALALNPGDPEALKALAVIALRRGEVHRARQHVAEALRADPFDAEARLLKEELEAADFSGAPAASPPPASLPELVRALVERLEALRVPHLRRGRDLLLRLREGGVARVDLRSLHVAYARGGRDLATAAGATARELAGLTLGIPRERDELLARALPVLRDSSFRAGDAGAVSREGPAGLMVYYVLEDPELVRYLPGWALEQRGVTLEELDRAAWENLDLRPVSLRPVWIDQGTVVAAPRPTGLWALAAGDGHDGARVLGAAQRARLGAEIAGEGPYRVDLGRRELTLLCSAAQLEPAALLDALPAAPDGIPGRFLLEPTGRLSVLAS